MSWRTGNALFFEIWPLVRSRITDKGERLEFTKELLRVFLDFDADPCDFRGRDPEVDGVMDEVDPLL